MFFLEDIRVVDLGLLLELKSDLGRENVGDHWFKVYVNLYVTFYVFLGKVEQGVKLNTEGMMD